MWALDLRYAEKDAGRVSEIMKDLAMKIEAS